VPGTATKNAGGPYTLQVATRGGTATLWIDGVQVLEAHSSGDNIAYQAVTLSLEPGPHRLEIVQRYEGSVTAGVQLLAQRGSGAAGLAPLENLTPY
jgi:hypothetical protein